MPWTHKDAKKHNKKAVGSKARKWSKVANSVLKSTGDDVQAIKTANKMIKRG